MKYTFGEYVQYLKESKESDKEFSEEFDDTMKDIGFKYNDKTKSYENIFGTLNGYEYIIDVNFYTNPKDAFYIKRFIVASKNDRQILNSEKFALPYTYIKDMKESDYSRIVKDIKEYVKRCNDVYVGVAHITKK